MFSWSRTCISFVTPGTFEKVEPLLEIQKLRAAPGEISRVHRNWLGKTASWDAWFWKIILNAESLEHLLLGENLV